MKRKTALFMSAVLTLGLMAGCGGGDTGQTQAAADDSAAASTTGRRRGFNGRSG